MLDLMVIILGNIFVFESQSISLNLINRVCFHTREDAYVLSVIIFVIFVVVLNI